MKQTKKTLKIQVIESSPRRSWIGYSFTEALARNKDYIKSIVAFFGTINIVTTDWKIFFLTLAGMVIALAGKLLQDAVDYYFSEVEL
jgi:hypothetical protein